MPINASTMSIISTIKDGILCVFKPSGIPTTLGKNSPSLTEMVQRNYPDQSSIDGFHTYEGGLLYRLDNSTSGLVLFATSQQIFGEFVIDSQSRLIRKHYIAYVQGHLEHSSGTIDFPIAHAPKNKEKMVAQIKTNQNKRGEWRAAQTYYQVIREDKTENRTWLHLVIYQGCRHQIRVHCAAIGHPLIGDVLYDRISHTEEPMFLRCHTVEWVNKKQTFSLTDLALAQEEKAGYPNLSTLTI